MRYFSFLLLGFSLLVVACDANKAPTEEELKVQLVGVYCAEDYKLTLNEDGSYLNGRSVINQISGKYERESCGGEYSLSQNEEGAWVLKFEKAARKQRTISSCEKEFVLWSKKEGSAFEEGAIRLRSLFDNDVILSKIEGELCE